MKVSVVIPVYNEEEYIGKCLEALTHQTHQPDEIIVVNNNSKDSTETVVKKFKVTLVNESEQGMTFARNRGFNEAAGDVIARCDADSIPPANWIEKIHHNFTHHTIDALTGPVDMYDLFGPSVLMSSVYIDVLWLTQGGKGVLIGPNMALSKKIWEKIKRDVCMDNTKVHEDVDLAVHINKVGGTIRHDKTMVMPTSGRRIKNNPFSFFVEYPQRLISTFQVHQ